jgi:hypothetical protein
MGDGKKWKLRDQLSDSSLDRHGDDLVGRGLYVDLAPWQPCVFSITPCQTN